MTEPTQSVDSRIYVTKQPHIPQPPILVLTRSPYGPSPETDVLKQLIESAAFRIDGLITGHRLVYAGDWKVFNPTTSLDFYYKEKLGRPIETFYSRWMQEWAQCPELSRKAEVMIIEPDPTYRVPTAVWAGPIYPTTTGNYATRRDIADPTKRPNPTLCVKMESEFRFDAPEDIQAAIHWLNVQMPHPNASQPPKDPHGD